MTIEKISGITLAVRDMAISVGFYQKLGFDIVHGGPTASFTSFRAGKEYCNLVLTPNHENNWWGRAIFWVSDVDAVYNRALKYGLQPEAPPTDAEWGERYFHIIDSDGHELSFARPLERSG